MFPPSLHKNIRELDKQITLLESECENMESGKRRKQSNPRICPSKPKEQVACNKKIIAKEDVERPFVTGPRIPECNIVKRTSKQLSPMKLGSRNSFNSGNIQKKFGTSREGSSTNQNDEQSKSGGKCVRSCPICGCVRDKNDTGSNRKDKKVQGVTKCVCGRELQNGSNENGDFYVLNERHNESDNEKQILHKGILHTNPGGTIEVTVTQKPFKTPVAAGKMCHGKKSVGLIDSDLSRKENQSSSTGKIPSKKTHRHPKWSEILAQESDTILLKRPKSNKLRENDVKSCYLNSGFANRFKSEHKIDSGCDSHMKVNRCENEVVTEKWNDENECPNSPVLTAQKRPRAKSPLKRKNVENIIDESPRTGRSFVEKEIQCNGCDVDDDNDDNDDDDAGKSFLSEESFDPLRTLYTLISSLKRDCGEEEARKILSDLEVSLEKINEKTDKPCDNEGIEEGHGSHTRNKDYIRKLHRNFLKTKKLCEKLMKERIKLSEDLAVKDRLLSTLCSKEKEYLSVITNLKVSLEKKKCQAEDNIEILKELNITKNKLLDEAKVADALRRSHAKMQEQVQKCMLENDKLKTEMRLNKLESQKFCVLLAGKDAEIKRYKDEVESFQRQISDQLAALRSNNAANEVQKAMEAIIQQSQAFGLTDLDSAFSEGATDEKNQRLSSRQKEKMMHSSPTSTKSSTLDCSWNHISSIHEEDFGCCADDVSNGTECEVLIGDLKAVADCPGSFKKCPGGCETDDKRVSSFASCKSAGELSFGDRDGTNGDAMEREKLEEDIASVAVENKVRKNIEELFEDLKMKCSKKLLSIPSESVLFEDLFSSSETSDFSEMSRSNSGASEKDGKC